MAGNPGDPVDFVPAACEAAAIANCILSKDCKLDEINPESFLPAGSFGALIDEQASFYLSMQQLDLCIIAALQQAFLLAGCDFPGIEAPAGPPDLSDCLNAMETQAADMVKPLGPATGIIDVTFDEAGRPVRIQA